MKTNNIKIGDRVRYYDRSGKVYTGEIIDKDEKNGLPVFDVDLDNGEEKWGYADQFELLS